MNAGKVRVSEELLLEWLDFKGGRIRGVASSFDIPGAVDIIIEHSDMPTISEGGTVVLILPSFACETAVIKKWRTHPPKKDTNENL